MYFHYFVIVSPQKRAWPFIWINLNFLHLWVLMPSLVEIGPVILEKKMKCENYRQMDGWCTTCVIIKAYLCFQLRWAKNEWSLKNWGSNKETLWMMQYSMNSFSSTSTFKRFKKKFAKEIYVNKHVIVLKFHFDPPLFSKKLCTHACW